MARFAVVVLVGFLTGCAARNYYPGARPADIIACRNFAYQFGPVYDNQEFNNCMNEAGYRAKL